MGEEQAPRRKRRPKPADPGRLKRWALGYLDRYATSSARLRRMMTMKAERAQRATGGDPAAVPAIVATAMAEIEALGLLDDRAFAAAKARALFRRGLSIRAIRARLAQLGLGAEDCARALAALEEIDSEGDAELTAALTYARKRRLGPYRPPETRGPEAEAADLARLGRRGFPYELAERVAKAEDPDDILPGAHSPSGA